MRALTVTVSRLGNSSCIAIPLTLARMFEWAPGARVRAKLVEGGEAFEKEVRALYGGRAAGILVPKEILDGLGLVPGDEVAVPFHEWKTVAPQPWPDE